MMMAPFEDEEWQIWALGNRMHSLVGKRVTKVFEIHDDLSEHGDPVKYAQYLVAMGLPMVVGEGFPLKADHVRTYPFQEAKDLWGSEYLTSSSAYMLALAILEGATHIGVYGVDMAVDNHEYFWQRPGVEAWIGFAKGRGIEVTIPDVSPVGKSDYIEGRKSGGKPDFKLKPFTEEDFKEAAEKHTQAMAAIQGKIKALESDYQAHGGAFQVYERLSKVARAIEAGQKIEKMSDTYTIKG
jgi:hypothetical protein